MSIINKVLDFLGVRPPESQPIPITTYNLENDIKYGSLSSAHLGKELINVDGVDYYVTVAYFESDDAARRYGFSPEDLPVSENPQSPLRYVVYYKDPKDPLLSINYSLESWPPIVEAKAQAADEKFALMAQAAPGGQASGAGIMAGAKMFAGGPPPLASDAGSVISDMHAETALSYVLSKIGNTAQIDGNAGNIAFEDHSYPVLRADLVDKKISGSPLDGHEDELMSRAGYVRVNVTNIPGISDNPTAMCTVEYEDGGKTQTWHTPLPSGIFYSGPGEYYIPRAQFFLDREEVAS